MASEIGRSVHGFLHTIGDTPFFFSFYLEKQVEVFFSTYRADDEGIIHLDATENVIDRIKNQKVPLYYCMLPDDINIPVMNSTSHTSGQ